MEKKEHYTFDDDTIYYYDSCLTIEQAVNKLNYYDNRLSSKKKEVEELREIINLYWDVITGVQSYIKLKQIGEITDDS